MGYILHPVPLCVLLFQFFCRSRINAINSYLSFRFVLIRHLRHKIETPACISNVQFDTDFSLPNVCPILLKLYNATQSAISFGEFFIHACLMCYDVYGYFIQMAAFTSCQWVYYAILQYT